LKEVRLLAENLAQVIREEEALAKSIVADAKSKAAEIIANAQAEAERSMKSTRQLCHRQLREAIVNAEVEAEEKAVVIMRQGQSDAKAFYEQKKGSAGDIADWLVGEVIRTYGSSGDD